MPRPRIHVAKAKLLDGTEVQTRTIGCKPYLVAIRFTINDVAGAWEAKRWCDTMSVAHNFVEVQVITTSCHIASGASSEPK